MLLDQWQALAGLHSGEALNNITLSFLPIGVAIASRRAKKGGAMTLGQNRGNCEAGLKQASERLFRSE